MNRAPRAESEKPLGDCHPGEEIVIPARKKKRPTVSQNSKPKRLLAISGSGDRVELVGAFSGYTTTSCRQMHFMIAFGDRKDPFLQPTQYRLMYINYPRLLVCCRARRVNN